MLLLPDELPRPTAMLFGSLISLIVLVALPFFASHSGGYRQLPGPSPESLAFADAQSTQHSDARNSSSDAADRKRIIDAVIANLNEYYVYPEVAQKMADSLRTHEKNGDDDTVRLGAPFASLLSAQMRDASHDKHLRLEYSLTPAPDYSKGPPPDAVARFRRDMQEQNCTFEKVEVLPHNIGYLKLNGFPDPSICQSNALAAMAKLNDASAIIFDVRDNHGGSPRMVALIASYLFERPTHLTDIFTRPNNSTEQSWTPPPVPSNKLADKPAYVLISASTFSGGEEFPYDLKMLKRATLVGDQTAGAAHLTSAHRIDDHYTFFVPSGRPINPVSNTDWEGAGVEPDVKVGASDALETAQKLALDHLQPGRSSK